MPIIVDWDDDQKTVICYRYTGKWTWDEYGAAVETATRLIDSVGHKVDIIGDFSEGVLVPSHALSNFRKSWNLRQPTGTVVLVINSSFLESMVNVFRRLYAEIGSRLYVTKSLEEARSLIASKRQTGVE